MPLKDKIRETHKNHTHSDLHSDQEGDLEQHALQLSDGDMIDGSGAEFPVKQFGAQVFQVGDGERPQVKHVVARESVALFDDDGLGAEHRRLDARPETAGPATDDEHARIETRAALFVLAVLRPLVDFGP